MKKLNIVLPWARLTKRLVVYMVDIDSRFLRPCRILDPPDAGGHKTQDDLKVSEMSRGSQEGTVQSLRRRGSQADERGMTMLDIFAATTFKSGGHGVTPPVSLSIPL